MYALIAEAAVLAGTGFAAIGLAVASGRDGSDVKFGMAGGVYLLGAVVALLI